MDLNALEAGAVASEVAAGAVAAGTHALEDNGVASAAVAIHPLVAAEASGLDMDVAAVDGAVAAVVVDGVVVAASHNTAANHFAILAATGDAEVADGITDAEVADGTTDAEVADGTTDAMVDMVDALVVAMDLQAIPLLQVLMLLTILCNETADPQINYRLRDDQVHLDSRP